MYRIFFPLILVMFLSVTAHAETVTFTVTVDIAHPFTVDSVVTAELGALNITHASGSVTYDASTIQPVSAPTIEGALPNFTTGTISSGGQPLSMVNERVVVVYIQSKTADYDVALALQGTPTLEIPSSTNPTPILVTGITSNVEAFNSLASPVGNYVSLCIGPILDIPSGAKAGTYTGDVTVDISSL